MDRNADRPHTWWTSGPGLPVTVRGRLLLTIACFLVMVFAAMAAVTIWGLPQGLLAGQWRQQEDGALRRLGAVADNKKELLALWFGERFADLNLAGQSLTQVVFAPDADRDRRWPQAANWLRTMRASHPDYHHLELVSVPEGEILLSTDRSRIGGEQTLPGRNQHDAAIPGERFAFFSREEDGSIHLCLAVQLILPEAEAVALVFHIDIDTLMARLQDTPLLGRSGQILLVDIEQVLLSPLHEALADGGAAIPLTTRLDTRMAQYAAWGIDGMLRDTDHRRRPVLAAVRHVRVLPDFGFGMIVSQQRAEVFAPIARAGTTLALIAGLGLILLLAGVFVLITVLLRPIEAVTDAARRLRQGQLDSRADVEVGGEAGVLAQAFNTMADEVQRWNERLRMLVAERTAELGDANRHLAASEARLKAILENSVDGIALLRRGEHVYANAAYLRLFGYLAVEELHKRFLTELISPECHAEGLAAIGQPDAERPVICHRLRGRRRDGGGLELEMRVASCEILGDTLTLVIFRDLTAWNQVERARLMLADFNQTLIERAPVGILVYDQQGNCLRANPAAAALAGGSVAGLLAQNFHEIESWRGSGLYDLACRTLAEGEMREDVVQALTSFGRQVWVQARFSRLPGDDGALLVIINDLTELKRAQEELERANAHLQARTRELEESNSELESFSSTVSHDLRSPIRALAGFPDLLETHLGSALDERGRHYLTAIRTAAQRMAEITTALLNFSRLGRVELVLVEVDMETLTRKVLEDLAPQAAGRQVCWRISPLPVVMGDSNLLRLVMTNLLANALKFTRPRSTALIEVECEAGEEGWLAFTVRDNGEGFDMRYADRLFKVFSRLHANEPFEGTGIGLATVSRIVQRHGGRIWAQGQPGLGASFSFTLRPGGGQLAVSETSREKA